jgi:hypothetical protein
MNSIVTTVVKPETVEAVKKPRRKKKQKHKYVAPGDQKGSREAKRKAAVILEVLAGARGPGDAAEVLGVSANRYYQFESRALQGLVTACEPRPKGSGISPEKELAKVRRKVERLENDVARYQALARVTQRAVGVRPPTTTKKVKGGKKRKRRKPTVRALKAAEGFRRDAEVVKPTPTAPMTASAVE